MKKRQKLPGAQLFTLRTQTLLYKGLNHLQKYDLAVLIGRIQNEDETYVHSRKLAGKHFNQPMDLGGVMFPNHFGQFPTIYTCFISMASATDTR